MEEKIKLNIFTPVVDWKDLQNKVCLLFNQIGLKAETEKIIETPRGEVEVDVFAIDPNSVDKISYIVECKNWTSPINQSVIHSFTTVMNETGCNIGYIISKNGFQSGAIKYTKNTNIRLFTFDEIQSHYYKLWMMNYFAPQIEKINERCNYYCEPFNSQRDREIDKLDPSKKKIFFELYHKYGQFITTVELIATSINYLMKYDTKSDYTMIKWEEFISKCNEVGINISSSNLSDILYELEAIIKNITRSFDHIFKNDIFA